MQSWQRPGVWVSCPKRPLVCLVGGDSLLALFLLSGESRGINDVPALHRASGHQLQGLWLSPPSPSSSVRSGI